MGRQTIARMASCVLLVLFPASSLFAADTEAAMLYTSGAAWVNGAHVPRASYTIFSGDLLQTRSDSVANINEPGSIIAVDADSLVKFEPTAVRIEHGGVNVSTSKKVSTIAGDVKVTPTSTAWTEFNVSDVDGTVRIAARKGDLAISDGKETVTLQQGQETTRDESTSSSGKGKKGQAGTPTAASGGIMNSPIAVGVGAAAVIGVTTWVLTRSSAPASPSVP